MAENQYLHKKKTLSERIGLSDPILLPNLIGIARFVSAFRSGRLIHYLPQALFLVALGVLYIGNRHHIERLIANVEQAKLSVEDTRAEYIEAKANYMYALKRPQIIKQAQRIGLIESSIPPEIIYTQSQAP